MTIMSKQLMLSHNQSIANTTTNSENVIDLGPTMDGTFDKAWNGIPFLAQVTKDIVGATTLQIKLQISDTGTSGWTDVGLFNFDGVAAGSRASLRCLPYGVNKRYLRANYIADNATDGAVTAGFTTGNEETS